MLALCVYVCVTMCHYTQKETKTEEGGGSVFSLLTISYYQNMFDVTTSQVTIVTELYV